jgi:hypothetical protein
VATSSPLLPLLRKEKRERINATNAPSDSPFPHEGKGENLKRCPEKWFL